MKCSSCNTENPEEAQFCSSCGEYLDWTATSTSLPVVSPPPGLPPPAQPPAATARHPDSPTAPATEVLPVTPPRARPQRPTTPRKAPEPGRPAPPERPRKPEEPQAAQRSPVQPARRAQPPPTDPAAGSRPADASGIRCPACGRVAAAGARFCRCGTALPAAPPVVSRPAAPPRRPGPRPAQVAAALGVAVFVIALLWGLLTLWPGRGADRPAQATASAPADPTTTGYPAVRVTAEGRECAREGTGPFAAVGTENTITSCALAANARKAYVGSGGKGEKITIDAYSPKSNKTYRLTCEGAQPTRCTGGTGVRVIIYGGKLVVG